MKWREQWDEEGDAIARSESDITPKGESLTQQSHAADADLNTIVARFGITDGTIPPQALDPRYFAETDDTLDLRKSLEMARDAQARFEALPVAIRKQFGYDPAELYDFVSNPANAEEAVKLGLLHKTVIQQNKEAPPAPLGDTTT